MSLQVIVDVAETVNDCMNCYLRDIVNDGMVWLKYVPVRPREMPNLLGIQLRNDQV
jgi:hypothetical protein